jgi:hypothetical protein
MNQTPTEYNAKYQQNKKVGLMNQAPTKEQLSTCKTHQWD